MSGWPFENLTPLAYGAILADPPWNFRNWSPAGEGRHAKNHYRVMSLHEIKSLPVGHLAAPDCVLFLWVSDPMLPEGIEVMRRWGFAYKTVGFTWIKRNRTQPGHRMGMGYWTRANPELCLLGTLGCPHRLSRNVRQLVEAPTRTHSRKPDEIYERIEQLVDGPYVELFARNQRPGWKSWGNETERFTEEADV